MGNLWSPSPPSRLLESSSQISALFHCDNCGKMVDDVNWKQCNICQKFDLCRKCGELKNVELNPHTLSKHKSFHPNDDPISIEKMPFVMVGDAEKVLDRNIDTINEPIFKKIMKQAKIHNDWELAIVMDALHRKEKAAAPLFLSSLSEAELSTLNSMIVAYHIPADENTVRVLSLDGGGKMSNLFRLEYFFLQFFVFTGVRGYMSIKVLEQLIKDNYLPDIDPQDKKYEEKFEDSQRSFTNQFDYFVGTSTGGLIAFCLATEHPLLAIKNIYENSLEYFTKSLLNKMPWKFGMLGNVITARYDHHKIHETIHDIIEDRFKKNLGNGEVALTAENATLGDLDKLLNPTESEGSTTAVRDTHKKVLLINAYNTTKSCITVFNTSYKEHSGYLIADVLKATMAAPTYFAPWQMCEWEKKEGHFGKKKMRMEKM